jgi:hypothetical protein
MSLTVNNSGQQKNFSSTLTDVGLDMLEILQYGQIAAAVGAIVILMRDFLS